MAMRRPAVSDFESMKGVIYECARCGYKFDGEELAMRQELKCPTCGYRVLKKVRPPIVKRVKAE